MTTKVRVPTSAEHPLGTGAGITITETPAVGDEGAAPAPRQWFGLVLFLVGVVLFGLVAYRISTTLLLAYVGVLCLVVGVGLSYGAAPNEEA